MPCGGLTQSWRVTKMMLPELKLFLVDSPIVRWVSARARDDKSIHFQRLVNVYGPHKPVRTTVPKTY